MATDGTIPKLRFVKCPRCCSPLSKRAGVPVYSCGGCGAVIRASAKRLDVSTLKEHKKKEISHETVQPLEEVVEIINSEGASKLAVDSHLIGMEDQAEDIMKLLDVGSGGVLFVVIHGVGGIGKTTHAKVVFNHLSTHFQGSSFVRDIQEKTKFKGLQFLQHQLLSLFPGTNKDDEFETMKDKFFNKKVLIILDDVDQKEQIKGLVGKASWFGSGSRIIITTRNKNVIATEHERFGSSVLKWPKVLYYEMRQMEHGLALQLFSRHALGEDSPYPEHRIICKEIVDATGGHPLALEIIGSYLKQKNKAVWKSTLVHLQEISQEEVEEKLKISYEALENETKQIFLDIACLFCAKEQTFPVYLWDACGYSPNQRIETLRLLSLVKIVDDNKLRMHDRVRDFGRKTVRENAMDPANCSRLWVDEEIVYILEEKEETGKSKGKIEAISVCDDDFPWDITLSRKELQSLPNLRYLKLCRFRLAGDIGSSLSNLKWLSWHYCPSDFNASNVHMESLVILDLSKSYISHQWGGWIQIRMTNLKVLNLSHCKNLTSTPDLSGYMKLETLIFEDCVSLATVHSSIGKLELLKHLNLKGCISLHELPDELCYAKSLEEIIVSGKGQSLKVPKGIGGLTRLSILVISNVKISELPSDIGELNSLVELDLSGTIADLPYSFGRMMNMLTVIKLENSSIRGLPPIGMLKNLKELNCRKCEGLKAIPEEIVALYSLRILDLSFTSISLLPPIGELPLLQTLDLESCYELEGLPQLPESLVNLSIVSRKLRRIPDLSALKSLIHLKLATVPKDGKCKWSFSLDWVGKLHQLETLELRFPVITHLGLGSVTQLSSLHISTRDLQCSFRLPLSLSRLFLAHIDVETVIPNLSRLKRLTFLELHQVLTIDDEFWIELSELQSVEHLSVHNCKFQSLPTKLRALYVRNCQFPDGTLDLTELNHLVHLEIGDCEQLHRVRGVPGLETLEEINIWHCSLEMLEDLSSLKRLETLKVDSCGKLREIKGLDGVVKSLKQLEIYNCTSLCTNEKGKRKREE